MIYKIIFFAPDALAGFNDDDLNLFSNYSSWNHSNAYHSNDKTMEALIALSIRYSVGMNYATRTDVNGDGLVDILYHKTSSGPRTPMHLGMFVSQGGFDYTLGYKCVITNNNGTYNYYGDCADTSNSSYMP
jgi:hypothetical protein